MGEIKLTGDPNLAGWSQHGDPVYAKIKVWEPASGVPQRGTILFSSGGNGDKFMSDETQDQGEHNVAKMMADLSWMGFRVIDRAWVQGWTPTYPAGQPQLKQYGERLAASRYASLVKDIYNRYHCNTCGAFVVVGHSGGTAEVGYGLTTYHLGDYIDLAVLLAGPAIARLDNDKACGNRRCPTER